MLILPVLLMHSPSHDNENTKVNQVKIVILLQFQILITNFKGNVKRLERRIYNQILGVEGLTPYH